MTQDKPEPSDTHLTGTRDEKTYALRVKSTPPGMAYIIGSGPSGATCHSCGFWEFDEDNGYYAKSGKKGGGLKPSTCAMYRRLTAGRTGPPVDHINAACKYYEKNLTSPDLYKQAKKINE